MDETIAGNAVSIAAVKVAHNQLQVGVAELKAASAAHPVTKLIGTDKSTAVVINLLED